MKKSIMLVPVVVFFMGCNMNPSKEARIQKLERELEQTLETVHELQRKVIVLEEGQIQLEMKLERLQLVNE